VRLDGTPAETVGIVPRAIEGLFERLEHCCLASSGAGGAGGGLRLRWNSRESAVTVENLFVFECRSAAEALGYYKAGVRSRVVASHQMNQASSRSHSVLTLTLERRS
ncbi:unnamed protein product, partial [Polarella glacialis]